MIHRISLATDFSPEGAPAFHAALALAVAYRSRLDILHVTSRADQPGWDNFPRVRETLEAWSLLPAGSRHEDVRARLGVGVGKFEIHGRDAPSGIADFIDRHRPDLLVAASHGRGEGFWHSGSVAMDAMRKASLPALLFGPAARGMVVPQGGALRLETVLMPVADSPPPGAALARIRALLAPRPLDIHAAHIGTAGSAAAASIDVPDVTLLEGEVVPSILEMAARLDADLIAMPTALHKGLLGALRGSTTEKVLRNAPCAILALPS